MERSKSAGGEASDRSKSTVQRGRVSRVGRLRCGHDAEGGE
jgi:hypothetical protein